MMKVIYDRNLQDYAYECRDDVCNTILKIIDYGKESEFESWLKDRFPDGIEDEYLYDLFRDEWEEIYLDLGMPIDDD